MKFYCFYTQSYEHWMHRCVDSFAPWLPVIPILMNDLQDWDYNCLFRAKYLYQHMLEDNEPVMLLDSDLKCLREPTAILTYAHIAADHAKRCLPPFWDVIVHDRGPLEHANTRYCAGIVGFNHTGQGKATLAAWTSNNKHHSLGPCAKLPEQSYLKDAIDEVRPKLENLGVKYNYVVPFNIPADYQIPSDTVIVHGDTSGPAHRGTRFK